MQTLGIVMKERIGDLTVSFFALFILLILASSLMYFVEHEAQPEVFSSIPSAMWWGVITLTTVGYGDVYPVTALGRFIGAIIAILGIGMFALPAGILASGFAKQLQRRHQHKTCPHCGKDLDESTESFSG